MSWYKYREWGNRNGEKVYTEVGDLFNYIFYIEGDALGNSVDGSDLEFYALTGVKNIKEVLAASLCER